MTSDQDTSRTKSTRVPYEGMRRVRGQADARCVVSCLRSPCRGIHGLSLAGDPITPSCSITFHPMSQPSTRIPMTWWEQSWTRWLTVVDPAAVTR